MTPVDPENRFWHLPRCLGDQDRDTLVLAPLENLLFDLERVRYTGGISTVTAFETWADDHDVYLEADLISTSGSEHSVNISIFNGRLFIRIAR